MWAEAIITSRDCEDFVRSMMPFELALDDRGRQTLSLEHPSRVALVADKGILIETPARLCWTVADTEVPLSLRTAEVLLAPMVAARAGRDVLVLTPRIVRADFVSLPDGIDATITARLNDALAKSPARLVWDFSKTLDFHFKLPSTLRPPRQIDLAAKWARVRVTDEALVLALSFHAEGVLLLRPAVHARPAPPRPERAVRPAHPPWPPLPARAARPPLPTIPEPEPATRPLHAVPLRKSS